MFTWESRSWGICCMTSKRQKQQQTTTQRIKIRRKEITNKYFKKEASDRSEKIFPNKTKSFCAYSIFTPTLWLQRQSSGAVWKSRWTSWAPVPNEPTVSVDVKQHFTIKLQRLTKVTKTTTDMTNSKHWFTTSFLQPLPYLVTPQGSENCQLTSNVLLVLKQ